MQFIVHIGPDNEHEAQTAIKVRNRGMKGVYNNHGLRQVPYEGLYPNKTKMHLYVALKGSYRLSFS